MELYIAEKPSLAATIATFMNGGTKPARANGFYQVKNCKITWCVGHLYSLFDADDYDANLKSWKKNSLPILPERFLYKIEERNKKQVAIINGLLKDASSVVHCGDPDKEGQYLVDLVINHSCYKGDVLRLWPDDLTDIGLRRVFQNIKPNEYYRTLSLSAQRRAFADWLVGINFTRLFTCLAQEKGYQGTLSLGRVQTPTFALVYNRCSEIQNFKSLEHYSVEATFQHPAQQYVGEWVKPDNVLNESKYCVNKAFAEVVVNAIRGQRGTVLEVKRETINTPCSLPFSLGHLQTFASGKWGYSAKEVLSACQYLYEHMHCLSYPRTDCTYLSEGAYATSSQTLDVVISVLNLKRNLLPFASGLRPKCFNDKKTTAHTAIAPTTQIPDFSVFETLSENEKIKLNITTVEVLKNIYSAVSLRYLAQFLVPYSYESIKLTTSVNGHNFSSKGKRVLDLGWRAISQEDNDDDDVCQESAFDAIKEGDEIAVKDGSIQFKKTEPPEYFTEGSLIDAMTNISRFVIEPEIKKCLKESDGIGTPATRADIIEKLKAREYVRLDKRKLKVGRIGYDVYPAIPAFFKTPAMTAVWESALNKIQSSTLSHTDFDKNMYAWVETQIAQILKTPPTLRINVDDKYKCNQCGDTLIRKKGGYGFYWRCINESCRCSLSDYKSKPLYPIAGDGEQCVKCHEGKMVTRVAAENRGNGLPARIFLGCSKYPDCKHSIWSDQGSKINEVKMP